MSGDQPVGRLPCTACGAHDLAICQVLEGAALRDLAGHVAVQRVAAGRTVFTEGEPGRDLFTVTEGMLKLYRLLADGRRQITGFLTPGDLFGLVRGSGYAYTAEAVTEIGLCRLPRRRLDELLARHPALEHRLLASVNDELVAAQDQMLLLGRKTAREKLATFLLLFLRREEERGRDGTVLTLPMGRGDIADYLGLTVETVSRTFTQFRSAGLIRLPDPARVEIADRRALEALADGP